MSMVMEARTRFEVCPLSPVLGAEVFGLDLSQPLDAATRDSVYRDFVRYQVLCFRGPALSKDQHIAFTEQFGTLERHIARNCGSDNPLVHTFSNLGPDGKPSGNVGSQAGRRARDPKLGAVAAEARTQRDARGDR